MSFLCFSAAATSLDHLHLLGITHILNAAEGTDFNQIMTGNDFYQGTPIKYYGISADDDDSYDLSRHFDESSDIIKQVIGKCTVATISDMNPM